MVLDANKIQPLSVDAHSEASDLAGSHVCGNELVCALLTVRQMETSNGRTMVFDEIKQKNPVFRIADHIYDLSGERFFQPFLLLLYMLKCVLSVGATRQVSPTDEAVAISTFENERTAVARISALVSDIAILNLTLKRAYAFRLPNMLQALALIVSIGRVWPLLTKLARNYPFMPSARIASALAFYMSFRKFFEKQSRINAAIIASNYSPEAVGLAAAARHSGRNVVYTNHSPVPAKSAYVPAVRADFALFYGERVTQTYRRRSRCAAEVALIGQPVLARKMEWREQISSVGIFLTAGTKNEVLQDLVESIRLSLPSARIIVRQHPVTLLKIDLTAVDVTDPNLEFTLGNPLEEEIARCDLVICGNSGVALNVLSGGRPVAYISSLDRLPFDYNGFVENRLVHWMPWWSDDAYDRLRDFYQSPQWQKIMRSYDAGYGADGGKLLRSAGQAVRPYLTSRSR